MLDAYYTRLLQISKYGFGRDYNSCEAVGFAGLFCSSPRTYVVEVALDQILAFKLLGVFLLAGLALDVEHTGQVAPF